MELARHWFILPPPKKKLSGVLPGLHCSSHPTDTFLNFFEWITIGKLCVNGISTEASAQMLNYISLLVSILPRSYLRKPSESSLTPDIQKDSLWRKHV